MSEWLETVREEPCEGIIAEMPLSFLQREGSVRLCFDVDATVANAKAASASVNQLLNRLPSLESTVADATFKYYLFLVKAFRKMYGCEVRLPKAANADALKSFYQLTTIYMPEEDELKGGRFGLGFECDFDIEHGLGIRFCDWQIEEVGEESEVFSLS